MNKIARLLFLALLIISVGCAVQKQSKFTSSQLKAGMTKENIIGLYGKPYKESASIDNNQTLHETLFYKEQLYLGQWYEINNILHFENSVFKSLEQGKEQLLYQDNHVLAK